MGIESNASWNKYALISYIVKRQEKNTILGKTAIQKLVYFMQEAKGVPCGYDYIFYNFGPYSQGLAIDLEYLDFLEAIHIESREDIAGGYCIRPGTKNDEIQNYGNDFIKNYRSQIEEVMDDFGMYKAKDLELRATILYCYKFAVDHKESISRKVLLDQVKQLKPRFSNMEIEDAVNELQQKGYISF